MKQEDTRSIAELMLEPEEESPKLPKISPKFIIDSIDKLVKSVKSKELLVLKSANQSMKDSSLNDVPNLLFDHFWLEGELCILYADTNLGKSILAVQIADSISKGEPVEGFSFTAKKQPVLYFDFELSDKQFEARYSNNYTDHYRFDDSLYRVTINSDADIIDEKEFNKKICRKMEEYIMQTGAKVVIIDNLTYLNVETEKARFALPLMQYLKRLKSHYGLSILMLAHTPKRNPTNPLSKNDLQGSKMMMNFCDSSFAIGESQTMTNIRYLKQIKQRNIEHKYHTENVCVFELSKKHNFLGFTFAGYSSEYEHLYRPEEKSRAERDELILKLKKEGLSSRKIADRINLSHTAVIDILKKYKKVESTESMETD